MYWNLTPILAQIWAKNSTQICVKFCAELWFNFCCEIWVDFEAVNSLLQTAQEAVYPYGRPKRLSVPYCGRPKRLSIPNCGLPKRLSIPSHSWHQNRLAAKVISARGSLTLATFLGKFCAEIWHNFQHKMCNQFRAEICYKFCKFVANFVLKGPGVSSTQGWRSPSF